MSDSINEQDISSRGISHGLRLVGIMLLVGLALMTLGIGLGSKLDVQQGRMPTPESNTADNLEIVGLPSMIPAVRATITASATSQQSVPSRSTVTTIASSPANPASTFTPEALPQQSITPSPSPTVEATPVSTSTSEPGPLPTPFEAYSWTLKVPILMYHYISEPPEDADKYRLDLSVSPSDFREQMQFLVDNGYQSVSLTDLSLAITNKQQLPEKPVILTLDDGYLDNYEIAFPILRELGLTATFFIATEFVDQTNPNYMSWSMIKEMAAAGMSIEPHSKTHPDLTDQDREFIIWEVLGSQETLEAHIGQRPNYFAYPSGRYNDEVLEILKELDFWGAVTTEGGVWHGFDDRYEWTRLRVRNTTTIEEYGDLLE
jgi:peptidoglycan/xylan/chitin deacetylase (PgdA/CDA1 family)